MANATNVTKANSTGTPPNGLYPPPPMVANNTNTTDFADGYVVSAFPSESHVSADSDTDPRPLSTAQWCWLNTTTPPVNWTEPPPPAPPGERGACWRWENPQVYKVQVQIQMDILKFNLNHSTVIRTYT